MGRRYQTQGWRVNKNRWRWKTTLKKPALKLLSKQCKIHFREQRGHFYLPFSPRCRLLSPPLCFPFFFSPHYIHLPWHGDKADSWLLLPNDSNRLPANQTDEKMTKYIYIYIFCILVQIVTMAVCLARHEALTRLNPLVYLYLHQLFIIQSDCTEQWHSILKRDTTLCVYLSIL